MMLLLQQVTLWWAVLFVLGIIAFPFASIFFSSFFDKGYAFAKIIGLIGITYAIYVLATMHVLPFTSLSLCILLLLFLCGAIFLMRKTNFFNLFLMHWKIILFEEILFFAALFFWSYIKSFQPDIHGLEKFMDYGFLNSILRTTYFPAKDMWMAPLAINYYYFGHIATALVTKLSFLSSSVTFNLMLATLFACTFTQGFSLGANLIYVLKKNIRHALFAGLLTAILLTFGGNLHTLYTFFTPYQNDNPVPPTQLVFSPQTFPNQYWYPNATRFIYHTIHEFPIYSFVVSDLHGHVLDIPTVLLIIAIFLVIFINPAKPNMRISLLLGFLTAIAYMTNAWDGLIYLGVSALLIAFKAYKQKKSFLSLISYLLSLFLSFVVIGLPFSIFFKPFASHIGINCAPQFLLNVGHIGPILFEQGYCQTSPLWQLCILYGFFFFWLISLVAFLLRQRAKKQQITPVDVFVVGLGFLGFSLIIIPEFVYLKDIYTTYFRANTMFKLVYQSFILLMIVSGYTVVRVLSNLPKKILALCYTLFALCLLVLVLIYPYFAIMSYFNNLKNFQGLNGQTYLKTISADDYAAVKWINANIKGQPVMLEAQGDSYTDYERISSNTGLPTVFGWMVHEWLWRGTYDIVPGRIADVTSLYTSDDIVQTKQLLQKYHVQYVYIGDMERAKYPRINEQKFAIIGTVIYSHGSVKIYKIF